MRISSASRLSGQELFRLWQPRETCARSDAHSSRTGILQTLWALNHGAMYDDTILSATSTEHGDPSWEPLEQFLPYVLCGGFMYMHTTSLETGIRLHAYKHSETRRYLLLDADADAWEDVDHGRYRRMRHSDAIEQVFPSGWLLEQATEKGRDAIKEALRAAWEGDDGDDAAGAHILPSSPACGFRRLPGELAG